jgi:transcriptional regulator with XRE-family HTH domain
MGTHAVQRDATARTVSENVNRHRLKRKLGLRGLAKKLGEVGRPLTHSAVDQIEKGTRRVDVDDLMALAAALDVSPITLLMPAEVDVSTVVVATGLHEKVTAKRLWSWLNASYPVKGAVLAFYSDALPSWERDQMEKQLGPMAGLMDLRDPRGTDHGND